MSKAMIEALDFELVDATYPEVCTVVEQGLGGERGLKMFGAVSVADGINRGMPVVVLVRADGMDNDAVIHLGTGYARDLIEAIADALHSGMACGTGRRRGRSLGLGTLVRIQSDDVQHHCEDRRPNGNVASGRNFSGRGRIIRACTNHNRTASKTS